MTLPTRSAASLNAELTAYSERYLERKLTNQAFTNHPLLDHLLSNSWDYDGGNEIVVPVVDGNSTDETWITAGSTFNLTHANPFTQARYEVAQMVHPIVIDYVHEQRATGEGAVLRYVEESIDVAVMKAYDALIKAICLSSTGTNKINSIFSVIDSTGALGGLNPSTAGQEWWASTEQGSAGSFTTNGPGQMRSTWLAVSKYKTLGSPTAIFMSNTSFKAYQASGLNLSSIMRTPGGAMGVDIATSDESYNRIPIQYEPHLDAIDTSTNTGVILFVNNKGLRLAVKPGQRFKIDPWVDLTAVGRKARATTINFMGQLICQSRASLAKIEAISA